MFLLAFYACLRVGEITHKSNGAHNLQLSDITFLQSDKDTTSGLKISFKSFKHSTPNTIHTIVIKDSSADQLIPSMTSYLKLRGTQPGPLFMWSDSKPILYSQFQQTLSLALQFIGPSPSQYSSHSFRLGRATHALLQGYSELQVMKIGRWSSTAHLRYLRPPSFLS